MKDACQTNQENPVEWLIKNSCYRNEFRSFAANTVVV